MKIFTDSALIGNAVMAENDGTISQSVKLFLTLIFTVFYSLHVTAKCVSPVHDPSSAYSHSWSDVFEATAQKTLNPIISEIQDIKTTGTGQVNLDFYALTFDSGGKSPEMWMSEFRTSLNRYIYSGTSYSVYPFNQQNKILWESDTPRGAVLIFNLSQLFGVPFERGAVVASCIDSTSFIFSTISIHGALNPGDHPVSGNRGFGFIQNPDGSITFFTKAADRLKGNNNTFATIGAETTFSLGAKVWNGLLDNLTREMASRNPRNRISHRRVATYPIPSNTATPTTPCCLQIQPQ